MATPDEIWEKIRDIVSDDYSADNYADLRRKMTELDAAVGEHATGIEAFFKTVGDGMIKAQQSLDTETLAYLAGDPAVPTTFRIPKVNAEINFSAIERASGGFLARIFTGTDEKEHATKHKVSFDIVSAPPPPELVQQQNLAWLSAFVVSSLTLRRQVQAAVEDFKKHKAGILPTGSADEIKKRNNYLNRIQRFLEPRYYDRSVILQSGASYALLLFLGEPDFNAVKLEILSLTNVHDMSDAGNRFAVDGVGQQPVGGKNVEALHNLLAPVIAEQATLLAHLNFQSA